ncbi:dTDP-4-dehydrorhamnose reductase [Amaricoccus solimangrovi]|uniref:dTDP-4-dehydrorhamnose reductase n=1 Tax=Amaricoccus solimangrovi TaxID=2589815 RepID=A0A501WPT0_9RHOB|nr:dTDP-4-dehydrorhamnose reductase [Amaricoccus solimangrovi]TPE51469.1 dTDP-4-dehydrorhamnose reductase [Amaricoccus solimangrovi]
MRALIFGATGQVARELARTAGGARLTVLDRAAADLSDAAACAARIAESDAEVVINAAAHTAVDRAEAEPERARAINAAAPGAMARAAAAKGVPFLHVSTDYVFDGAPGRPWREDDPTGPLGVYGASKRAGEEAVLAAGGDAVILRTAWVFSSHGGNFVKTMLRHGRAREEMRVVGDQRGGPTPARDIARALWTIARARRDGAGAPGIYHFAGAPAVSWAEFAEAIFAAAGWERRPRVTPIATADWPTPARRPANSVLDCGRIARVFGIAQPDWRAGLDRVVAELSKEEVS